MKPKIFTIDLDFLAVSKAIASYLLPHTGGVALVECGPGSTLNTLQSKMQLIGYDLSDITDVLLTHIHLDHAGAAGYLARQGARIHVHEIGAKHMIDPLRLLNSARLIYRDKMDSLWGEFLPVPEDRIHILKDGDKITINELSFFAIDTPGHAYHHMAYMYEDLCFTGDVAGVRIPIPGKRHIRLPMPPPEFNLELWVESIEKLIQYPFTRIAPTHFGIYDDVDWHLEEVKKKLLAVSEWIDEVMPQVSDIEDLRAKFLSWTARTSKDEGLTEEDTAAFEAANPSRMSAEGINRYWVRNREPKAE